MKGSSAAFILLGVSKGPFTPSDYVAVTVTLTGGAFHLDKQIKGAARQRYCYIGIDLDPSKPKGMPLGLKLHTFIFTTKYINMAKA